MTSLDGFYRQVGEARSLEPVLLDEPVPLEALQTPALVIDLDILEGNLSRMQGYLNEKGIALRPHTKMHKCPIIARKQVEHGAVGVCAAKISEAEVMCAGGMEDVLVTSPIVSPEKIMRFVEACTRYPGLKIVVDDLAAMQRLDRMAGAEGISIGVFIDVDPGMGRTGVEAGEAALNLGLALGDCEHLSFCGLQMYAGNCMHVAGYQARKDKYGHTMRKGSETRAMFAAAGIETPVFSGGGTGTYDIESELGVINELQAGSYAFMDMEYRDIGGADTEKFTDFPVSLFVLVTAISKPQPGLITVDAGFKSLASDKMAPEFRDLPDLVFHWGGDEHGIVQLGNLGADITLGSKLPMLTPHCDPTVNLHDYYYTYRHGMVSEIWPISARGLSQ